MGKFLYRNAKGRKVALHCYSGFPLSLCKRKQCVLPCFNYREKKKNNKKMGKSKDVGHSKSLGINNILAPWMSCAHYCDFSVLCEAIRSLHNKYICFQIAHSPSLLFLLSLSIAGFTTTGSYIKIFLWLTDMKSYFLKFCLTFFLSGNWKYSSELLFSVMPTNRPIKNG